MKPSANQPSGALSSGALSSGALILEDGTALFGQGIGAKGAAVGELCFNTAMTGYQEILTDPSYAAQIIVFTFPHIGNVGVNGEDIEALKDFDLRGVVMRTAPTEPSNWRARRGLNEWLAAHGVVGLAGVDTRVLTKKLRTQGFLKAAIAHAEVIDVAALHQKALRWSGLADKDLVPLVSSKQPSDWHAESDWRWPQGFGKAETAAVKVVALDYGIKRNILRLFAAHHCHVDVVPAATSAEQILAMQPDGIFLSNGPGDPAATGAAYAIETIAKLIAARLPIFGICLGHQLLALALGARTRKMHQGHHGANHPVKNLDSGQVEIVSMNHGWMVDRASLPETVEETHISLFDNSNCGIRVKDRPIFSVQYHPEASPGPQDSHYLFQQFFDIMKDAK